MGFRLGVLVCAAALVGVTGGLAPLSQVSAAAPPTDLYVSTAASCGDSGPGTRAAPFCTVQAAADAVVPGQTVHIGAGIYRGAVTVTRSGTAGAPISFVGPAVSAVSFPNGQAALQVTSGTAPVLALSGVHDVDVAGVLLSSTNGADGVDVTGSSRIGLTTLRLGRENGAAPAASDDSASVRIDGVSSDVSVTRDEMDPSPGVGVRVEAGARNVTVATDEIAGDRRGGVVATGAVGLDVTGNTISEGLCEPDIALDGATTATVEDNALSPSGMVYGSPCATSALLSVAADAAGTVKSDDNAMRTLAGRPAYSWAGTGHATAADFAAAVPGQGAHDIDSTDAGDETRVLPTGSPLIDSADADAPGLTALDFLGNPRPVDEPDAPNTGTGSGTADRGAVEAQSTLTLQPAYTPSDATCAAPCTLTVDPRPSDSWGEAVTSEVDFGDDSAPQPAGEGGASHRYTVPGTYTAIVTATNSDGLRKLTTRQVTVATAAAPAPTLGHAYCTDPYVGGTGYHNGCVALTPSLGADAWEVSSATYDFGDGTASVTRTGADVPGTYEHAYSAPGAHTATLTTTDVLGRTSKATATFTVGDVVVPQTPVRAYDTRTSGRHAIPAHGVLALSRSQFATPNSASVHGFYLNVTVAGATASGVLSVYPDGTARPASSVLNFPAGQSVANTFLAVPGPDGKVDFYNSSAKSIDLVLDQFGVEAGSAPNTVSVPGDTYSPVAPARLLDTRDGTGAAKGAVAAKANVVFQAAGVAGVPSDAAAVVLNLTATGTTSGGYLAAYPHGTAFPGTSNLNWASGESVANLAVVPLHDGKVQITNRAAGAAHVIADVVGYYHRYGTASVLVPTASQVRVLDTRTGAGTGGEVAEIPAKGTVRLQLTGANGLPTSNVTAVHLNLTVTHQTGSGYVSAFPDGSARPNTSSVNFHAGRTVANNTIVPVGADGAVELYNSGPTSVDLIADLSAYYYDDPEG